MHRGLIGPDYAVGILDSLRGKLAQLSTGDEEFYALAAEEIESGHIRQGLWAKALATAEFDEQKTQTMYLKSVARALRGERQTAMDNAYDLYDRGAYEEAVEGLSLLYERLISS